MPISEERTMILRMIEEGKVSAEEGARLLAALNEADGDPPAPATAVVQSGERRSIHIRVRDLVTGREKVSVKIPTSFVAFILRFVPDIEGVDVAKIKQAIDNGYSGTIMDVRDEENGQHVEITLL